MIRMENESIIRDSQLRLVPAKHSEWTRRLLRTWKILSLLSFDCTTSVRRKKREKEKNLFFILHNTSKVWQLNTPGSQLLFTEHSHQHSSRGLGSPWVQIMLLYFAAAVASKCTAVPSLLSAETDVIEPSSVSRKNTGIQTPTISYYYRNRGQKH